MEYFYEGIQRLDWGFGNPNKTAAFIALLLVTIWGFALLWKRGFYPLVAVCGILSIFLIQTVSRGGALSAILGMLVAFALIRPKMSWKRYAAIAFVCGSVLFYATDHGVASRYSQGLVGEEDRSISNRWLIYRAVPQMLVDAPFGWGKGNAPEAYQQWYQPAGRTETYLNLVNSHFTWLVEWGTWRRLGYCILWTTAFIMCLPRESEKWYAIALSALVTFFIASSFSSVAHVSLMWIIPSILLVGVLVQRAFQKTYRIVDFAGAVLLGGLAYSTLLLGALLYEPGYKLSLTGDVVAISPPKPSISIGIYAGQEGVLGTKLGHSLREIVASKPEVSFVLATNDDVTLEQCDLLVACGTDVSKVDIEKPAQKVVLANPSLLEVDRQNHTVKSEITVLWGEFHPSYAFYQWHDLANKHENVKFVRIQGEGTYLESWVDYL